MGVSVKVFFVEEGDKLRRIPLTRFERLFFQVKKPESLPEYAGQKVRYALVIFNNENRKPTVIRKIDYSFLSFDETGRMRRDEWDKLSRLAVESIYGKLYNGNDKSQDGLINASHIFAQKQMEHEFMWKPTVEIERAIINAVFIEKKVVRKPYLKLVKSPPKQQPRK